MTHPSRSDNPIPILRAPQTVPSEVCLKCEVCCRFPELDSSFRPFFAESEIQQAIALGIDAQAFPTIKGSQIIPVPNPLGEGYLCPAFDPHTAHCRIYAARPLDCQIYPFVVMWDQEKQGVLLGWDTKCPFMVDQRRWDERNHSTQNQGSPASDIPERLHRFSGVMAERMEAPDMMKSFSDNPQLVMGFQEDVVVIQRLPRLTHTLLCEGK